MVGNRNEPGERSVPRQLFSSWSLLRPLVAGMLGVSSTTDGARNTLSLRPQLPPEWREFSFTHLRVGSAVLNGTINQLPGQTTLELHSTGAAPEVHIAPALPYGALVSAKWGQPAKAAANTPDGITIAAAQPAATAKFVYTGGIGIVPLRPNPERGAGNEDLKILGVTRDEKDRKLTLTVAGRPGRTYKLELLTTLPRVRAEGADIQNIGGGFQISIPFAAGNDWVTKTIVVTY